MQKKKKEYFDTKYIIQLQKGDHTAFDIMFNYYQQHVYWMGISFFSNEEKAKDLVQSVFLEIYQTINKLKNPDKFYSWMNRITYSRCLLMLRYEMKDSLHYTKNMGDDFTDTFIQDSKSDDAITFVQKEKVKEIIIDEIQTLPPKYRTICYLRFFEDLSYAEISEITSVPLGTITNYIGRLKPKLKNVLQKNGFTSASSLSLILLPNIVEYFNAFIEMKNPLSDADSKKILQEVKNDGMHSQREMRKQTQKSWKVAAYSCIGIALILPIGVGLSSRGNNPLIEIQNGENAVIQKITYPEYLTNSPFKIQVELSNENYDEILLDDKTDLTASWNGDYKITLMKKGEEIDSRTVSITNIDRDIPIVTGQSFSNGIMTLGVDDKDNQINFEHVEFYENGAKTNRFKIDEGNKEIYISKDVATNNILKIPDTAGNVLEVRIIFYERDAIKK